MSAGQPKGGLALQAAAQDRHDAPNPAHALVSFLSSLLGDRGCCFTFHRLAASKGWADLPNRNFYVDAGFLAGLLHYLRQTGWDVVTMDEAVRRSAKPGGGRFVNFSIDDCYRDTAEAVVPLFRKFGVPVTLFVTAGIPDGTLPLSRAGLETILSERDRVTDGGVTYELDTPKARRAAFAAVSRRWDGCDAAREYLLFCAAHGADPAALDRKHAITWAMLDDLRNDPLVEVGAHSISHPHIAGLSPAEALAEMKGSRERIERRFRRPVRHFAFPYGRRADCGPRDFALAREAGFASAATTIKGLLRSGADPYGIPRNSLNGAHQRRVLAEAHLTGLSGLAARIVGRV